jgi:hypothetical protein
MNVAPERRLCAAVVHKAVQDARGGHVEAIVWLASTEATKWLDLLDMPQSSLLIKSGWLDWASVALEGDLTDNQRAVLLSTLSYLTHLN